MHPTKFDKTSQSQAIKEYVLEGHQIVLAVFNNYRLISKIIKNNLNKM